MPPPARCLDCGSPVHRVSVGQDGQLRPSCIACGSEDVLDEALVPKTKVREWEQNITRNAASQGDVVIGSLRIRKHLASTRSRQTRATT